MLSSEKNKEFDSIDLKRFDDSFEKAKRKMGKVNIIIAGKTGVGKSTLVNAIFKVNLAKTGTGNRITPNIVEYTDADIPLKIYDTVGLELDKYKDFYQQIVGLITNKIKEKRQEEFIHCIWYCVNAESSRFEDAEENFIKRITENPIYKDIPVFIIITQSYFKKKADALIEEIKSRNLPIKSIIKLVAQDMDDEDIHIKAYGCDELTEKTIQELNSFAKNAFASAIKHINVKRRQSRTIITGAAISSGIAAGTIPIPIADLAAISAMQIGMLAGITAIFGMDIDKKTIKTLIFTTIGGSSTSNIILSLIKMVPVVGTAIGGTTNAVVAPAITYALGEAYLGLLSGIWDGSLKINMLENERDLQTVKNILNDLFQENYDKARNINWIEKIHVKN